MAFSPEEISQILKEFFKVVGTRQYIGARYVPLFGRKGESSIVWDNSAPYEPLTIVLYQGNSFTSRQYVPEGVDINNTEFWAVTGNYNAQVEQYRREVTILDGRVDTVEEQLLDKVDTTVLYLQDFSGATNFEKLQNAIIQSHENQNKTLLICNCEIEINDTFTIPETSPNTEHEYIASLTISGARFVMNTDMFSGNNKNIRGCRFVNCSFIQNVMQTTYVYIDFSNLVAAMFENCYFYKACLINSYTVDYYTQSLFMLNCVVLKASNIFINCHTNWNLNISLCRFENTTAGQVLYARNINQGVISKCTIEGFTNNVPIVFHACTMMVIEDCYFEANTPASIDVTDFSGNLLRIDNCSVELSNATDYFIINNNAANQIFISNITMRGSVNTTNIISVLPSVMFNQPNIIKSGNTPNVFSTANNENLSIQAPSTSRRYYNSCRYWDYDTTNGLYKLTLHPYGSVYQMVPIWLCFIKTASYAGSSTNVYSGTAVFLVSLITGNNTHNCKITELVNCGYDSTNNPANDVFTITAEASYDALNTQGLEITVNVKPNNSAINQNITQGNVINLAEFLFSRQEYVQS